MKNKDETNQKDYNFWTVAIKDENNKMHNFFKSYCEETGIKISTLIKLLLQQKMNDEIENQKVGNAFLKALKDNPIYP